MSPILSLHVVAGTVALGAGAVALYARKGARVHRKSGMVFVVAMLIMSATGAVIAAIHTPAVSVLAGVLTFYLVVTAVLTVRRPAALPRSVDALVTLLAAAVAVAGVSLGVTAANSASGVVHGFPAPAYFIFGAIALVAALLDVRVLRAGPLHGAQRIIRHLWRMCTALLIAAASLFLGQPQVFPEAVRHPAVLAAPVLLVLVMMLFWLARMAFVKRPLR